MFSSYRVKLQRTHNWLHQINLILVLKISFQELKAKLAEEISRMRYFITGQRADMVSLGSTERSASEVEVLIVISSMVVPKLDPT